MLCNILYLKLKLLIMYYLANFNKTTFLYKIVIFNKVSAILILNFKYKMLHKITRNKIEKKKYIYIYIYCIA
jgi:hypothetical protein